MSTDEKRANVLVSGGMDSATAAALAIDRGYEPYFLHTSYGQNTEHKEFQCAEQLAQEFDVRDFLHVETEHLAQIGSSSLTDDEIEVDEADMDSNDIPTSYVPFRNANLLSMAVSYAEATDCDMVFVGAHSEDYSGYPDCRPEFFDAFQQVINEGTRPESEIEVEAPFVDWTKTDIVECGTALDVPYEITWSCYRADAPACGTCDSCAFRLEAFQNAGIRDPIEYEQRPEYAG